MPNYIYAFLVGTAVAAIIYLITRFVLGDRADKLIGGAVPMAFFVSPWWAGLAGALVGHFFAIFVFRYIAKKSIPTHLRVISICVLGAYYLTSIYATHSTIMEAQRIGQQSLNYAWEKFSGEGDAQKYVADHYRPCIESKLHSFMSISSRNDPSVCLSSVVHMAASTKGQQFANSVQTAVEIWNMTGRIDSDADAKIKRILTSL
ncbi:hypothetical protein [Undibacterium oligocarboniphilum]|uniref:Uncharacterized protein n=1 Tax=Undibacterium oligocarboniphilum TaxID=666702 RepID=A0A850QJW4_9BURK|nr:hypothetical protein [Undibacterium oligocarboniphilum]MBC3871723.1 hypothetical protein [Undibacterium oligocarboniphilum]NVO79359.1 hypothetical protein [Undibacterium oligocarboniphilum]